MIKFIKRVVQNISNKKVHKNVNVKYIFLHIEKTAGTSLVDYMRNSVGKKNFYYTRPELLNDPDKVKLELDHYTALAGHIQYDQINKNYPDAFKITFLRDPIERMISFYYFVKEGPETVDPITVKSKSMDFFEFLEYCEECNDRRFVNGMTYKLANDCKEESRLDSAKENLKKMDFIGLQEYFDDSLAMLSSQTGWKPVEVAPTSNITKQKSSKSELSSKIIDKIVELNKDDIELYKYGLNLFEKNKKNIYR